MMSILEHVLRSYQKSAIIELSKIPDTFSLRNTQAGLIVQENVVKTAKAYSSRNSISEPAASFAFNTFHHAHTQSQVNFILQHQQQAYSSQHLPLVAKFSGLVSNPETSTRSIPV